MINLTQNEVMMVSGGDLLVTVQVSTEGISDQCVNAYTSITDFKSYDQWGNIVYVCSPAELDLLGKHYENGHTTAIVAA